MTVIEVIHRKLIEGERLSREDGVALFRSDDLFGMGRLAAAEALKKNGERAFFIVNRHINPTNICVNRCRFCAFSRSPGQEGSYEMTIEEILGRLSAHGSSAEYSEVHIVGGLHPEWPLEHYLAMLSAIRREHPSMAIKAFTAVEVDHMAKISGLSVEETLRLLKAHGLDLMPGGGAEILGKHVREQLCPEKISGERWLEVMETAHGVGIRTNATMLYGHVEQPEDRVDHLLRIRDLQDRTSGFQAFIPLSYHPKNTDIGGSYSSGIDDLRTIAISRLMLDNVEHIKAYWIMLGEKISQIALLFGADDIDGTVVEEKITHSAGAMTAEALTTDEMVHLINRAGKTPVERDAFYNVRRTW